MDTKMDFHAALCCSQLSQWIYDPGHSPLPVHPRCNSYSDPNWHVMHPIKAEDPNKSAFYGVLTPTINPQELYIVFRGTVPTEPLDLVTNICVTADPKKDKAGTFITSVHAGMYAKMKALKFDDICDQYLGNASVMQNVTRVYITGHSLGGGLAALFALKLLKSIHNGDFELAPKIKVITFGAPMVIANAFEMAPPPSVAASNDLASVKPHDMVVLRHQMNKQYLRLHPSCPSYVDGHGGDFDTALSRWNIEFVANHARSNSELIKLVRLKSVQTGAYLRFIEVNAKDKPPAFEVQMGANDEFSVFRYNAEHKTLESRAFGGRYVAVVFWNKVEVALFKHLPGAAIPTQLQIDIIPLRPIKHHPVVDTLSNMCCHFVNSTDPIPRLPGSQKMVQNLVDIFQKMVTGSWFGRAGRYLYPEQVKTILMILQNKGLRNLLSSYRPIGSYCVLGERPQYGDANEEEIQQALFSHSFRVENAATDISSLVQEHAIDVYVSNLKNYLRLHINSKL